MKKVKKWFWIGGFLIGTIGVVVLELVGIVYSIAHKNPDAFIVCTFFGIVPATFAWIFGLVILYKMWAVIRYLGARAAPWQAVLFMFIPLYSYYWVFQAYWGWAKDYNKINKKDDVIQEHIPSKLAFTPSTFYSWTKDHNGISKKDNVIIEHMPSKLAFAASAFWATSSILGIIGYLLTRRLTSRLVFITSVFWSTPLILGMAGFGYSIYIPKGFYYGFADNIIPITVVGALSYQIHMILMVLFYAKACNAINTMVEMLRNIDGQAAVI